MRLYSKCGRAGLPALLLSLVAATAAAAPPAQSSSSQTTMQMPMVAPLFIENGDFDSTLVLVNGTAVSTYVDVSLRSLDGQTVATEKVQFSPHGEKQISIRDLRNSGTAPGITAGSIVVMQNPSMSGMAVTAALSMTRESEPVPNYIDQELAMPSGSGSQMLRGVSDDSDGSPLVAVSSLDSMPQHVTIECIGAGSRPMSKTVYLAASETLLTSACTPYVEHGMDFDGYRDTLSEGRQGSVGISLTSDAMPGSFAAFGLAPHRSGGSLYFSAISFTDPMMLMSTTTIYTGVPVGSSPLLPNGAFTPVLALTNFSTAIRHVTVEYVITRNGTAAENTVKTLNLAPQTSQEIALRGLTGDPTLQDSFVVQSNGSPGDMGSKLVSRSDSALHEVELLGKDLDDPNNGGNHPWTVESGTTSTLLLFNNTATAQYFNVEISAGTVVWHKGYQLQPMRTEAISINELMKTQAKDDSGMKFPRDIWSGQIEWNMPHKNAGRGRLLESNSQTAMARNFSCGYVAMLCALEYYGEVDYVVDGETVGYGELSPEECLNSCDGTIVGPGGGDTYEWSTENSGIASVSGSSSESYVSLYGAGVGETYLDSYAYDDYCTVDGPTQPVPVEPTLTLSRSSLTQVEATGNPSGGTFSYTSAALSGQSVAGWQAGSASSNPNTLTLTDPSNPNGNGAPSPGGLEEFSAVYSLNGVPDSDDFSVPTFGMSCWLCAGMCSLV